MPDEYPLELPECPANRSSATAGFFSCNQVAGGHAPELFASRLANHAHVPVANMRSADTRFALEIRIDSGSLRSWCLDLWFGGPRNGNKWFVRRSGVRLRGLCTFRGIACGGIWRWLRFGCIVGRLVRSHVDKVSPQHSLSICVALWVNHPPVALARALASPLQVAVQPS